MAVCTGCSLLCEDIEVTIEGGKIAKTKNLCRKGLGHFRSLYTDRAVLMADGAGASPEKAVARAAEVLRDAKRPLLFGWSNSTLEAQAIGIKLARKLGAVVDDTSSFCQGVLMEKVIRKEIPTCSLDDVRNYGDTILFWGSDPSSSHPRHMSRFSYFPRGEKLQKGYEEDRSAFAIDVRKSPTAKIVADGYFRIQPGEDGEFIDAIVSVLDGKIPKVEDKKRMISFVTELKKAKFGVVFPGLGLAYSLKDRMDAFVNLVRRFNEITKFNVIPVVGHYNTRGFNQTLFDEAGCINRASFAGGSEAVSHGPESSIMEAAKTCDAALVIGSDPISALPAGIARALARLPVITIDPHRSLTSDISKVVIPSAVSGLEAGGSALRMDGLKIAFEPVVGSTYPADADVLSSIMEAV